ncbi:MAG TPA: hypothetical protein VE982_06375 [Gaiellaceae bacterium]|nr:hypothetical protein [Gaiellaceae bacterium]
MDVKPQSKKGGDVASRLLQKMLMPIVAGAASAAATYVAKKGPQLLDDKVVPKVRELLDGAGGAAHDLPSKARAAAGGAGDVAERLTERARSVAGGVVGTDGHHGGDVSPKELEDRLRRRAKSRAARRKATR